jgi:hypothetical protein
MLLITHGDALAAWLATLQPGVLLYEADFCSYIQVRCARCRVQACDVCVS